MTVRIPLFRGDGTVVGFTCVDAADASTLRAYTWRLDGHGYVTRWCKKRGTLYMHREILGLRPGGRHTDHINRDPLDNRRCNLRAVTHAQNMQNIGPRRHGRSGYRGVWFDSNGPNKKRWRARVIVDKRAYYLGRFATVEEANRAAVAFRAAHMPFSEEAKAAA